MASADSARDDLSLNAAPLPPSPSSQPQPPNHQMTLPLLASPIQHVSGGGRNVANHLRHSRDTSLTDLPPPSSSSSLPHPEGNELQDDETALITTPSRKLTSPPIPPPPPRRDSAEMVTHTAAEAATSVGPFPRSSLMLLPSVPSPKQSVPTSPTPSTSATTSAGGPAGGGGPLPPSSSSMALGIATAFNNTSFEPEPRTPTAMQGRSPHGRLLTAEHHSPPHPSASRRRSSVVLKGDDAGGNVEGAFSPSGSSPRRIGSNLFRRRSSSRAMAEGTPSRVRVGPFPVLLSPTTPTSAAPVVPSLMTDAVLAKLCMQTGVGGDGRSPSQSSMEVPHHAGGVAQNQTSPVEWSSDGVFRFAFRSPTQEVPSTLFGSTQPTLPSNPLNANFATTTTTTASATDPRTSSPPATATSHLTVSGMGFHSVHLGNNNNNNNVAIAKSSHLFISYTTRGDYLTRAVSSSTPRESFVPAALSTTIAMTEMPSEMEGFAKVDTQLTATTSGGTAFHFPAPIAAARQHSSNSGMGLEGASLSTYVANKTLDAAAGVGVSVNTSHRQSGATSVVYSQFNTSNSESTSDALLFHRELPAMLPNGNALPPKVREELQKLLQLGSRNAECVVSLLNTTSGGLLVSAAHMPPTWSCSLLQRPRPAEEVLHFIHDVAKALRYYSAHGIAHGHLQLSNVVRSVSLDDPRQVVFVVSGFGLSHYFSQFSPHELYDYGYHSCSLFPPELLQEMLEVSTSTQPTAATTQSDVDAPSSSLCEGVVENFSSPLTGSHPLKAKTSSSAANQQNQSSLSSDKSYAVPAAFTLGAPQQQLPAIMFMSTVNNAGSSNHSTPSTKAALTSCSGKRYGQSAEALDLWAVGAMAFELLLGYPPFAAPDASPLDHSGKHHDPKQHLFDAILSSPLVFPSTLLDPAHSPADDRHVRPAALSPSKPLLMALDELNMRQTVVPILERLLNRDPNARGSLEWLYRASNGVVRRSMATHSSYQVSQPGNSPATNSAVVPPAQHYHHHHSSSVGNNNNTGAVQPSPYSPLHPPPARFFAAVLQASSSHHKHSVPSASPSDFTNTTAASNGLVMRHRVSSVSSRAGGGAGGGFGGSSVISVSSSLSLHHPNGRQRSDLILEVEDFHDDLSAAESSSKDWASSGVLAAERVGAFGDGMEDSTRSGTVVQSSMAASPTAAAESALLAALDNIPAELQHSSSLAICSNCGRSDRSMLFLCRECLQAADGTSPSQDKSNNATAAEDLADVSHESSIVGLGATVAPKPFPRHSPTSSPSAATTQQLSPPTATTQTTHHHTGGRYALCRPCYDLGDYTHDPTHTLELHVVKQWKQLLSFPGAAFVEEVGTCASGNSSPRKPDGSQNGPLTRSPTKQQHNPLMHHASSHGYPQFPPPAPMQQQHSSSSHYYPPPPHNDEHRNSTSTRTGSTQTLFSAKSSNASDFVSEALLLPVPRVAGGPKIDIPNIAVAGTSDDERSSSTGNNNTLTPQNVMTPPLTMSAGVGGGGPNAATSMMMRVPKPPPQPNSLHKLTTRISRMIIPMRLLSTREKEIFEMSGALPMTDGLMEFERHASAQSLHPQACATEEALTSPESLATAAVSGLGSDPQEDDDVNAEQLIEECLTLRQASLLLNDLRLDMFPLAVVTPAMAHLTVLDVANNFLTSIPDDIEFLVNLRRLLLGNNRLSELPETIGNLTDLETLDVNHNLLTSLPQSLMFCDQLQVLALDYNDFDEIPDVVCDLTKLRTLYLTCNPRVDAWPSSDVLCNFGSPDAPLNIGLDNVPSLFKNSPSDVMPNIVVMWNKVYPDEILPNLYCGSLRSAQSQDVYKKLHITHLLTMGRGLEPQPPEGGEHKVVIVDDIEGANIEFSFEEAIAFIDESLSKHTGCLVHCFAGMSRSATTVIAYLMMKRGMRLDEAYCLTRKGRPAIYPNAGFFNQLLSLDAKLYPGQRELDMASMERDKKP